MKRNSDLVTEERERTDIVKRKNPEQTERKRRRGLVEKKRRDRMNCSYMELMQLVPTVQRKKDTTKVEKAELLEMTVEHIRNFQLSSKKDDSTVAEPGQFHKAGFQDCSTKFIQYVNGVKGLGKNGESLQRNLSVFVEENLANTLGNNILQETKDSSFPSTNILNRSKALSSATTFKTSLPTICCSPTQVSSTNNNITQLILQPILLHNHILLHNGSTVIVNPDNFSLLTKPNPASIAHTSTSYIGKT